MRFRRTTRVFTGTLDPAPWVAVLFLLVTFLLLAGLVYTPGVRLQLPVAEGLPGTDKPTVAVALDSNGRLYFENQVIERAELKRRLEAVARNAPEPVVLVVRADKAARHEALLELVMLARDSGINEVLLAGLPRPFEPRNVTP
ncbi:MAG: biopolymer transporter ExbD [Verrucomicrobiae bacterium]|nr:biopolymer transporter ExbD [Verrucomicrobiae bacterium]MCX7721925.1 biopolymer transporter ExbD [Verrucomicrobiae bacterium]MDW7979071.1 biopolymer transporter ExbD [Verrucomicrobiales bacterium]